ncbi:MAG: hypothetical protein IJ486_04400 [Firmicutes bacterium]|nr:hypothetical protein [Bacillota bacterium]
MRDSKKCVKCGSERVVCIPGNVGSYGSGNNIQIGLTTLSAFPVGRYICVDCGYAEEWISKATLKQVEEELKKRGMIE